MPKSGDIQKIMGLIEDQRVLDLDQAAVRIPSHSYQEHEVADFYANRMADIGFEVEMPECRSWAASSGGGATGLGRSSRHCSRDIATWP